MTTTNTMTTALGIGLAAAHPNAAFAVPGVNFFQGAINFAEGIAAQLGAGLAKATDPSDASASTTGGNVVSSTGGVVGTIQNVESAAGKIKEIVADAKKGDLQEAVADGVDLLTIVFATLDYWKIDVPVVTGILAGKPNLHSAGVDKTA